MYVDIGARSDKGRVRARNEDCYCVRPQEGLLVVADGMGGHASGEIASSMAVEELTTHCLQLNTGLRKPSFRAPRQDLSEKATRLLSAAHWANRKIYLAAANDRAHLGMGTTLVAVWLEGHRMSLVHVGDSRVYLLRGGFLEQLTRDHSLVAERERRGLITKQEAQTSGGQGVLLRALGTDENVEVDIQEHLLQGGDVILLCTDGLTRMVSDAEIAGTLICNENAQTSTDCLVALANHHGGKDNVTAIVLRLGVPRSHRMLERFGHLFMRRTLTKPKARPKKDSAKEAGSLLKSALKLVHRDVDKVRGPCVPVVTSVHPL